MENKNQHGWINRKSQRITITVPAFILETLESESTRQGRSISNLSAYLITTGLLKERKY
jgi:transcriptional regulator of met regulon